MPWEIPRQAKWLLPSEKGFWLQFPYPSTGLPFPRPTHWYFQKPAHGAVQFPSFQVSHTAAGDFFVSGRFHARRTGSYSRWPPSHPAHISGRKAQKLWRPQTDREIADAPFSIPPPAHLKSMRMQKPQPAGYMH